MKYIKMLIAAAAMLFCVESFAQSYTVFSTGGTALGATNSYAVISDNSYNGKAPVVTYVNAFSDTNNAFVNFYWTTNQTYAVSNNFGITNYVGSTNGFVVGDIVVIQHVATDLYERNVIAANVANTNQFSLRYMTTNTVSAGDLIYKETLRGQLVTKTNTTPTCMLYDGQSAEGLLCGQSGKPLLIEIGGAASCNLTTVNATFK